MTPDALQWAALFAATGYGALTLMVGASVVWLREWLK